jgi:hypothetical protein
MFWLTASVAYADAPAVVEVQARPDAAGWTVDVTVAHPDSGWDHYADGWRVELADGKVLGVRDLLHPHVAEQPFTRSLGGIDFPDSAQFVVIRTRCNQDGWSTTTTTIGLP